MSVAFRKEFNKISMKSADHALQWFILTEKLSFFILNKNATKKCGPFMAQPGKWMEDWLFNTFLHSLRLCLCTYIYIVHLY